MHNSSSPAPHGVTFDQFPNPSLDFIFRKQVKRTLYEVDTLLLRQE